MNKLCILILTSTFPRWKDDTDPPFIYELCRRLISSFDIHVVTPHAPGCKKFEIIEGIHVHRFRYFLTQGERLAYQGGILAKIKKQPILICLIPFFLFAQLFCTLRLLKRHKFQLIHAHWLFPQGFVALLARAICHMRLKILCTAHGGDLYGLKGPFFNLIKNWVVNNCDRITVVSSSMRSDALKMGADPKKVTVIPMGIDLQKRFTPPLHRKNNASILFVGRLIEKKGLQYLLEAMPKILKTHPSAMLRIAGDGPERYKMENNILNLRIAQKVLFLGALSNEHIPSLYQKSDIVVFPSIVAKDGDREGFGLVLVEALGCECATVVTDLAAMQDIVHNGKTALIVPQKDSMQIAEKVNHLLDDEKMAKTLGRQGRAYVLQRFDWEVITRRYADLIHSVTD